MPDLSLHWMKALVVVPAIVLLGCARPSVMDRSATRPGYQIGAAKVVWIDDPALRLQVQKKGYGISPLTPRDYYVARMELGPIFDLFRCEAPSMIAARIAEKIVLGGEEVVVELKPESGRHLVDWENSVVVRATVKGRGDGSGIQPSGQRTRRGTRQGACSKTIQRHY